MAAEEVARIRNIAIVGQGGVGKTLLADALVLAAGSATRLGRSDDGTSLFDIEPEEVRRKTSITTAIHHVPWRKHEITILDTPGYAAFLAETRAALTAASGAVFVLSPHGEVKVELERVWSWCRALGIPSIAYMTRLDREETDLDEALAPVARVVDAKVIPIAIPIGSTTGLEGYVDLVAMRSMTAASDFAAPQSGAIASGSQAAVAAHRDRLLEAVAEVDDALLEHYLESGELAEDEIRRGLRLGVLAGKLLPVLVGTPARGIGVHAVLDAAVDLLGSPADLPEMEAVDAKSGQPVARPADPGAPFAALVFKTVNDPFAGKLSLFRVVSGRASSDSTVLNASRGAKERLGQLLRLEGKKQAPIGVAMAGEICAVAKLKDTASGDTLADEKAPVLLPKLPTFEAVMSFAAQPKSKADEEKATQSLQKMMEEDLALHIERDPESREIIVSGSGQLHIEVVVERLKRKYGVEVELKAPKVPYRETIKGRAEAQGKLKKQSGGRGQFADTWIKLEPLPRGAGFEFVDEIVGGAIPRQYIPAVEKGIREAMPRGILTGSPVVDFKVTLFDGSYHDVDSSEMAFKIAASLGFKDALAKARPVLLEPIMLLEVTVPDECMGDVIGDLNARRGRVLGVDPKPPHQVIRAEVPMAEVLKYAPDLRSMTSGRGDFHMAFAHYDEVPAHLSDKVIKEVRAERGIAAAGE
ncbi:MAG: elongation factor G [Polyangiaceae bacterium UTPRO1]|jgi:elongation factor G|nr:elongation factor G [Myxococcales bacterium]OQY66955.1 MAG: elongation factor G [Polyangiaceae bacterium UTPRO1]